MFCQLICDDNQNIGSMLHQGNIDDKRSETRFSILQVMKFDVQNHL
jgi:hypothetical protein